MRPHGHQGGHRRGGFAVAGFEGKMRQDRLKEIAERHGMRFVGPNCLGVVNNHHRFSFRNNSALPQASQEILPMNRNNVLPPGWDGILAHQKKCSKTPSSESAFSPLKSPEVTREAALTSTAVFSPIRKWTSCPWVERQYVMERFILIMRRCRQPQK